MLQDIPAPTAAKAQAEQATTIETARLTLRTPTLADAPAIARLANDRRIGEMTRRVPFPYREADAAAFIAALPLLRAQGLAQVHLIEHLGEPVGMVGIEGDRATPELGYWLGVAHWGRGFATEAAQAAIEERFADARVQEILAMARVANPASRNVLEKCGYVWTGCALHRFDVLGSSAPVDCFRLTREGFAAQRD